VPKAPTSVLHLLLEIVLNCQMLLKPCGGAINNTISINNTGNFLEIAKGFYKCLKPSKNCFNLSNASGSFNKVPVASKCYWQPSKKLIGSSYAM